MAFVDDLARGVAPPKFMTPQELQTLQYKNELAKIDVQNAQDEVQARNALRTIFRDPANLDPETGMPNRNAMARVFSASPEAGLKLQTNMNELARQREALQTQRIHGALYQLQINEKQAGDLARIAVGAQDMYDRLIAGGVPKDEAARQVTQSRVEQLDEASKSGLFSPGQLDRLRGPFDPVANRAFIAATPQYKEYLAGQKTEKEPPKTRNRIEGDNEVQEEWDPKSGTWKQIGKGPRFAKSVQAPGGADLTSWDSWSEEQKDKFADEAAKDRSLLSGIGRGAQGAKLLLAINQRIVQRQIDTGQPGAAQRRAEFRADSNSLNKLTQQYDAITSFENTALQNGKALVELAKKVDSTGVPVMERWIRSGRQNIEGDPDVSEFNAQIQLFGNEAAKILTNPSMSGVVTNEARREIQEFLPQKASAKQIERVVGRLEKDFEIRKKSTEQQMDTIRSRMQSGYAKPKDDKPAPATAPSGAGPKKITTKDEFDALPSGAEFIAPDGSRRKKK